jgi:hypothetical protein
MKRCLLCLPLLVLAPLGYFLGSYFDGTGVLPGGVGILISAGSMFILPSLVSGLFVVLPKTTWSIRRALVLCALLVQGVLLFVPSGATSETMGFAHRLRQEFPPSQLRNCAAHLRQKRRDGTLTLVDKAKNHSCRRLLGSLLIRSFQFHFVGASSASSSSRTTPQEMKKYFLLWMGAPELSATAGHTCASFLFARWQKVFTRTDTNGYDADKNRTFAVQVFWPRCLSFGVS